MQGSLHSDAEARRVIDHLTRRLGPEGFHFLVEAGTAPSVSVRDRVDHYLEMATDDNRMEKAKTELEKLAHEYPEDATVCFGQGVMHLHENDPEAALSSFTRAVELDPRFEEAWANKAASHLNLGHASAAVRAFRKVLEITPPDDECHTMAKQQLAELAGSIRKTSGMELDAYLLAEDLYGEAFDYISEEDYDQAIRVLTQNPERLPPNERTLTLLGLCHRKQRNYTLAREALHQALELAPEHETAQVNLDLLEAEEAGVDYPQKILERFKKLQARLGNRDSAPDQSL